MIPGQWTTVWNYKARNCGSWKPVSCRNNCRCGKWKNSFETKTHESTNEFML